MKPPIIRNAIISDLQQITNIYAHYVEEGRASFEVNAPNREEMLRRYTAIVDAGYPFRVAVGKERDILGFAYASSYRARPAYRFTVEDSIYVKASELRQGIGKLLLTDLIKSCENLGFKQMVAIIGNGKGSASFRLHKALGFRYVGTLHAVGFKFGEWLDSVILQRSL